MAIRDDDPLSVFRGAVAGVGIWAAAIFATTLLGLWLGISYKQGAIASMQDAFGALIVSTFAWLLHPQIAIGIAVSGLAFYVCLRSDSLKARAVLVAATLITWFSIAAWVPY